MRISGAEILVKSLLEHGTKTFFGYPGGSIMPTYDILYDYLDKLNHILVRHEQGAVHAAEGFARVTGEVGVCVVTSGPGATNVVTGIADAMLDSTPLVVIAGQVTTTKLGSDAFQECDVVNMMQPISKWAYQIRSAADVSSAVSKAFYIAKSGRPGPVVLDFTRNAQVELADYNPFKVGIIRSFNPIPEIDEQCIRDAAKLINNAKKPFVLLGQGIELAGAQKEAVQLIEKADMPAGCTLLGLSVLPSKHRLNKGMLGMHGSLACNYKTQECDLLISIGMRFDDRITGNTATYATQAKKIHFDIDKSEINKNIKVDVPVLGDCKETLAKLLPLIEEAKHTEWINSFDESYKLETEKIIEPEVHPTEGPLRMGEVINTVSTQSNDEAVLVTDVGQNQMMSARYFRFTKNRSIVTSGGFGTMGYGLPAAIGAAMGAPNRKVCLFVGDGGFQMSIQELGTIMEQKVPVKMILLNNNFLGNVRQWQQLFYDKHYSFTHLMNPDYKQVASAYNIAYGFVSERENLKEKVDEMLNYDGAYLLEVAIMEEDNVLPMCCPGHDVDDMLLKI